MSTKDATCSAGRSLVQRLCDGCRRRADGWTCGQRGRVCVGGGGTGGRVDRKMTGGGSGVRLSASRRSTTESHRRTTRPVPWYSLCRPPVPAHSPARPSVPSTLPCSLPPPTQASRAATDVSLFDPPVPPGSGLSLLCNFYF